MGQAPFLAPAVAGAAIGLAWLGRTDDAERWLDRVATPQPAGPELEREPTLHYARAFVRLGQGRLDEALEELRATHRLLHPLEPVHPLRLDVRGLIVLVDALRGDRAAVGAALALAGADEADGAGMRLATAALALADGSPQRALDALAPMLDGRPTTLHPRWATIHALLFDAAARDRLGDRAGAEASIERALDSPSPTASSSSSPWRPSGTCSSAIPVTARGTARYSRRSSRCSRDERRRSGARSPPSGRISARQSCGC